MPGQQRPVLQKSLTESASQEIIRGSANDPLKLQPSESGLNRNNNFVGELDTVGSSAASRDAKINLADLSSSTAKRNAL